MSQTGRFLLGFVAVAEGLAAVFSYGWIRSRWQLGFCRWWLMRYPPPLPSMKKRDSRHDITEP